MLGLTDFHKMFTLATKSIGCTAIAALALLYVERKDWLADAPPAGVAHSARIGELRHLVLKDGSYVDLNTGSEIRTFRCGQARGGPHPR
jgi:ferric-dicitrate binding protein FerR (iron transport regulator)